MRNKWYEIEEVDQVITLITLPRGASRKKEIKEFYEL